MLRLLRFLLPVCVRALRTVKGKMQWLNKSFDRFVEWFICFTVSCP